MKWLGEHEIVEDNMAIIKGENSHNRYHKICSECGAYKYLRDCSCGWKIREKNDE